MPKPTYLSISSEGLGNEGGGAEEEEEEEEGEGSDDGSDEDEEDGGGLLLFTVMLLLLPSPLVLWVLGGKGMAMVGDFCICCFILAPSRRRC
jgi:hypothetical protein